MILSRGGLVMWPLLLISILAVTLIIERAWFFIRTNSPGRHKQLRLLRQRLRANDAAGAKALIQNDNTIYGRVTDDLLQQSSENNKLLTEDDFIEAIEAQRPRLERYMATLSTIITAAPMLGILGTVIGIIASFDVLADAANASDPRAVSQGIAEALLTTAVGLVITLVTLLPYSIFRVQINRSLTQLELLIAAAESGMTNNKPNPENDSENDSD